MSKIFNIQYLISFGLIIVGLIMGSFLNCLAWRICKNESVFKGRSKCPLCGQVLKWFELVPVLSFIIQKARCRRCRQKISWQYPLVEIITASLFLLILFQTSGFKFQVSGINIQYLMFNIFIVCVFIVIFFTDLNFGVISDWVVWPSTVVIFISQLFFGRSWQNLLLAASIGGAFFGLQYLLSRGRWIGAGDIGLGVLMGAILGWPGVLVALGLAYVAGAACSLILILFKKKTWGDTLPLGVFLIPAAFVVMMWGEQLVKYLNI